MVAGDEVRRWPRHAAGRRASTVDRCASRPPTRWLAAAPPRCVFLGLVVGFCALPGDSSRPSSQDIWLGRGRYHAAPDVEACKTAWEKAFHGSWPVDVAGHGGGRFECADCSSICRWHGHRSPARRPVPSLPMALRGSQHEPLLSVCPAGRSAPGETRGIMRGSARPAGAELHISVVWLFVIRSRSLPRSARSTMRKTMTKCRPMTNSSSRSTRCRSAAWPSPPRTRRGCSPLTDAGSAVGVQPGTNTLDQRGPRRHPSRHVRITDHAVERARRRCRQHQQRSPRRRGQRGQSQPSARGAASLLVGWWPSRDPVARLLSQLERQLAD